MPASRTHAVRPAEGRAVASPAVHMIDGERRALGWHRTPRRSWSCRLPGCCGLPVAWAARSVSRPWPANGPVLEYAALADPVLARKSHAPCPATATAPSCGLADDLLSFRAALSCPRPVAAARPAPGSDAGLCSAPVRPWRWCPVARRSFVVLSAGGGRWCAARQVVPHVMPSPDES